jgi:hypothetical protein
MRSTRRRLAGVFRRVVVFVVVVEGAVAGIDEQLQHGVRVRVGGAGTHLHGQEEKQDQTEGPEDHEEP